MARPGAGGPEPVADSPEDLIPVARQAKDDADAARDAAIATAKAQLDARLAAEKARLDAELAADQSRLAAQLADEKSEHDKEIAFQTADRTADETTFEKFFDAIAATAVGSIDRSRSAAEQVQKASAAIAALYTGVLALVFSVTDNPLPARGVLAPIFLGLSVVLSTAYVAYLTDPEGTTAFPRPGRTPQERAQNRLVTLMTLTTKVAVRRSSALRASVVALGLGLAFIVMPFVTFGTSAQPEDLAADSRLAWPPAPGTGSADLDKILYDAQVKEAAARRAAAQQTRSADRADLPILLGGLALGVLAVIFVPKLIAKADPPASAPQAAPGPAPAQG